MHPCSCLGTARHSLLEATAFRPYLGLNTAALSVLAFWVALRHFWYPAGILVMIVLLCLTPVFKNMPQNAQAAVIIAAVIGLFRYDEWWFLWKVSLLALAAIMCIKPRHTLTRDRHVHFEMWQDCVNSTSRVSACAHQGILCR